MLLCEVLCYFLLSFVNSLYLLCSRQVTRLPKINKAWLVQLIVLYVRISANSSITKMDSSSIGQHTASSLFRPDDTVTYAERRKLAEIVQILIDRHESIFSLNDWVDTLAAGETNYFTAPSAAPNNVPTAASNNDPTTAAIGCAGDGAFQPAHAPHTAAPHTVAAARPHGD